MEHAVEHPLSSTIRSLNSAQLQAVKHSPTTPLQILAGPGSGKTKVLTCRVAYLILHYGIPASSICAVTFTNKAANEMKERLVKLLGEKMTGEIKMGTFHALCALFLRKYAPVVGLEKNFTVCGADESKKIVTSLLQPFKDHLSAQDITLKEGTIASLISKAKARGQTASAMAEEYKTTNITQSSPVHVIENVVAQIYESYEKTLRQTNSLDFDDLLLFGVKLFRDHSKAADWCTHVLVDEFQDTNWTQYQLMHALAVSRCITVVGDPDQSIYGWRAAEVGNISKMQDDYPSTEQILLEENYRSTGSILSASLAIVSQDKGRVQKSLFTTHATGCKPTFKGFSSEQDEAQYIAFEVKRTIAYTGGTLNFGDFAILLRFSALSRTLESCLQKAGIPSRILGGHKFFDRLEIKDLLSYLQLIDNPDYNPALIRAISVPSRGVGEKTLEELANRAKSKQTSMLAIIEKICDCRVPDIKPPVKRKVDAFIKAIQKLKQMACSGMSPADLIHQLLTEIDYETHLKKTQSDWETRWENVQELITFAAEVDTGSVNISPADENEEDRPTPLRLFLQASMLSSEGDSVSEAENQEKVTIVTCHAAKGLEWPVVFVPGVEDGIFPFYRTEDIEEERRLLYVACTRAQCLLHLSFVEKRKVAGETKTKIISPFISSINNDNSSHLFSNMTPQFTAIERNIFSTMLNRPEPDKQQIEECITEFEQKNGIAIHTPETWSSPTNLGSAAAFTLSSGIMKQGHHISNTRPSSTSTQKYHQLTKITPLPTNVIKPPMVRQSLENRKPQLHRIPTLPTSSSPIPKPHEEIVVKANLKDQNVSPEVGTTVGVKRRLGMGRGVVGYMNKKFKPPT